MYHHFGTNIVVKKELRPTFFIYGLVEGSVIRVGLVVRRCVGHKGCRVFAVPVNRVKVLLKGRGRNSRGERSLCKRLLFA